MPAGPDIYLFLSVPSLTSFCAIFYNSAAGGLQTTISEFPCPLSSGCVLPMRDTVGRLEGAMRRWESLWLLLLLSSPSNKSSYLWPSCLSAHSASASWCYLWGPCNSYSEAPPLYAVVGNSPFSCLFPQF